MKTFADTAILAPTHLGQVQSTERLFHAGMAWLLVVVAVAGFAPRSLAIIGPSNPSMDSSA